jgi:hypothetical protein
MVMSPHSRSRRCRQEGGIAILVAFMLLMLMSAAALGTSRNVIRELSTTGNVVQGGKASAAADAGVDWFIAWSFGDGSATGAAGNAIKQTLYNLETRAPGYVDPTTNQPVTTINAVNEMLFPKPADSNIQENFDVQIRYLGRMQQPGTGRGGNAQGPNSAGALLMDNLWQVTSFGRSVVMSGSTPVFAFRSVREVIATTPLQQ